ncbi:MAG TPA: tRNA (adenosine(37)-N6)-dimethylallyltransferase MiaA [Gemmatimonadales bacterium]|nr:tRNA (adenosine(37)-N6)-dimethylallyltransferase MiaA [Gemmatimonadales bacterium]
MGVAERPVVAVLVGATGVGKTAVAAELAASVPIGVISADARQVYRSLDIGTAKPDAALQARVPHFGLDLIDPGERYSAGRFARDAARWLAAIDALGREPLVVGGSGFYIRALADGLFREPPLDLQERERVRAWAARLDSPRVAHWATRLDRRFAGGGRQRAVRAIEVALLTGRPLSWWQREARASGLMHPWYIHLTLPREALTRRLTDRVDAMLAAGLVSEVERALETGVPPTAPGLDGVGYREVLTMLAGELPRSGLRDAIVTATRRYAKRQDTWFRHQLRTGPELEPVWVLDAAEPPAALAARILTRWPRANPSPPGNRAHAS